MLSIFGKSCQLFMFCCQLFVIQLTTFHHMKKYFCKKVHICAHNHLESPQTGAKPTLHFTRALARVLFSGYRKLDIFH